MSEQNDPKNDKIRLNNPNLKIIDSKNFLNKKQTNKLKYIKNKIFE